MQSPCSHAGSHARWPQMLWQAMSDSVLAIVTKALYITLELDYYISISISYGRSESIKQQLILKSRLATHNAQDLLIRAQEKSAVETICIAAPPRHGVSVCRAPGPVPQGHGGHVGQGVEAGHCAGPVLLCKSSRAAGGVDMQRQMGTGFWDYI